MPVTWARGDLPDPLGDEQAGFRLVDRHSPLERFKTNDGVGVAVQKDDVDRLVPYRILQTRDRRKALAWTGQRVDADRDIDIGSIGRRTGSARTEQDTQLGAEGSCSIR